MARIPSRRKDCHLAEHCSVSVALSPFHSLTVLNHSFSYRFALPDPKDVLGLPIGQHISVQAEIAGKDIMRSYTPTSSDDDLGHFDLLIKSYEKGNISRYFSLLKLGDKVRVKGPKGQFIYTSSLSRHLGMIAGGTGITPMLQIVRAAMKNPLDRTKISLIYANVNLEDILLKTELDELAEKYLGRFTVYYVLNNAPEGWKGGVGFVSKAQIEEHMPKTSEDIKVLLCGPPPMMTAMKKHLDELKYPAPRTVSKLADQVCTVVFDERFGMLTLSKRSFCSDHRGNISTIFTQDYALAGFFFLLVACVEVVTKST